MPATSYLSDTSLAKTMVQTHSIATQPYFPLMYQAASILDSIHIPTPKSAQADLEYTALELQREMRHGFGDFLRSIRDSSGIAKLVSDYYLSNSSVRVQAATDVTMIVYYAAIAMKESISAIERKSLYDVANDALSKLHHANDQFGKFSKEHTATHALIEFARRELPRILN